MSIYLHNYSEYNNILNEGNLLTGGPWRPTGAIFRATSGMKDDQKYSQYRTFCLNNFDLVGTFMWLNHDWANGQKDAWVQAQYYWQRAHAAGNEYNIPPIMDLEATPSLPFPSRGIYLNQLKAAVDWLSDKAGRPPILYSNVSTFKDYLQTGNNAWIAACPLWIASPRATPLLPPGWTKWALWQFALAVTDWPGISAIDGLNRWPGTKAEMVAWCKDASKPIPDYTEAPQPEPEPEPEPEPQPSAQLDRIEALVKTAINKLDKGFTDPTHYVAG